MFAFEAASKEQSLTMPEGTQFVRYNYNPDLQCLVSRLAEFYYNYAKMHNSCAFWHSYSDPTVDTS